MAYSTLITPTELYPHLNDPNWVVVDCRFNLMDTEAGRRTYRTGHIPGARYAHLDEDLSGPITPASGRHPLPDSARLMATFSAWGIHATSQVVAYDEANGAIAARLWWLLRWLGHRAVAVLDGGLSGWRHEHLPLSTEIPTPQTSSFQGCPDNRLWIDSAEMLDRVGKGDALIVDARAVVRYRGEQEPIDPVAGHVPGAINLPLEGNLNPAGQFLPPAALRERFAAVLRGRPPTELIHMCGSGVTACHNLLAMEAVGLSGSRLYAGSWSEWIRDLARPVAMGAE